MPTKRTLVVHLVPGAVGVRFERCTPGNATVVDEHVDEFFLGSQLGGKGKDPFLGGQILGSVGTTRATRATR